MSDDTDAPLAQLRAAFDGAFAAEPAALGSAGVELLTLRVGGDRYAVRLRALAGVSTDRRVEPMPCDDARFVGLASLKGALVPVFCLRALLGGERAEAPRWILFVEAGDTVGFAFDALEGHARAHPDELVAAPPGDRAGAFVREALRDARGAVVPVLAPDALVDALRGRPR